VRNGAPLLLGLSERENFVASDVQAILHRTNRIVYLKDHQLAICRRNEIELKDLEGLALPIEVKQITWSADQMDKSGYRHYMLKEIFEQPQALAQTIDCHIDHASGTIGLGELALFRAGADPIRRISLVACGTARHAALIGKYYIERFARIPVDVDYGSEFRYRGPILDNNSLLLAISQSGETADTLAALREGQKLGARSLSICNVRESTLARESEDVFYTNAGPEIGVASTKAFTTQLAALYMLAVQLGHRNGTLNTAQCQELTHELLKLPILIDQVLQSEKAIEAIAGEEQDTAFFFYMGRDLLYPIALEGALKLKEISYAHAEGYAAGELKHGPIALIDRHATIVVTAPKDQPYQSLPPAFNRTSETLHEKVMSNLQEVKSRGGRLVTFVSQGDEAFERESHVAVALPRATWALNPILMAVPLQLFAYHMALLKGTDVDKPRNLAKSVTVE
jgi:glucosamine--fructose-6-phosphate aminotransferase (isomerizing)